MVSGSGSPAKLPNRSGPDRPRNSFPQFWRRSREQFPLAVKLTAGRLLPVYNAMIPFGGSIEQRHDRDRKTNQSLERLARRRWFPFTV